MPSSLKNVRATCHRAITFAFHDLKCIIQVYLDDLVTHYHLRVDHPDHLCLVFNLHYLIQLNLQKCIFCVKVGNWLGFIIYKNGIRVDTLKVEEILGLSTLAQLDTFRVSKGWITYYGGLLSTFPIWPRFHVHFEEGHSFYLGGVSPRVFWCIEEILGISPGA